MEHIVVDGASTDGTVGLLQSAGRIRWISERDSGQSEALVKGFHLAKGDILSWLNADDELLPGAIRVVVDGFSRLPDVGWVYGRALIGGPGMRPVVEPVGPVHDRDLEFGNPIVQPSTFFRRSALDVAGSVDPELHLAMDLDLWLRFIERRIPRAFVPSVIAKMTYDDRSKTSRIARTEFMKENFLVYLKNGWIGPAYLALGALAAYGAITDGHVPKAQLDEQANAAADWAHEFFADIDRRYVRAAAAVEACFAEQHVADGARVTALRHLAKPAPWAFKPARRRIMHGLTKKLLHRLLTSRRSIPLQPGA